MFIALMVKERRCFEDIFTKENYLINESVTEVFVEQSGRSGSLKNVIRVITPLEARVYYSTVYSAFLCQGSNLLEKQKERAALLLVYDRDLVLLF